MHAPLIRTAALAVACLVALSGYTCGGSSGHLQINRAVAPGDYQSLGRTDVYVDIQGTGGQAAEVSVAVPLRECFWLQPASLRLARWDERALAFRVLPDSRYDRKTQMMTGVVDADGIYTALGLSRVDRVLSAQLEICRFKSMGSIWPECRAVLCLPMEIDSSGIGWSDSLGLYDQEVTEQFGNICEKCIESWVSSSFPECEILPAKVDTGGVIVTRPQDFDRDGLANFDELAMGTNPLEKDTDTDGLWDGWEVLGYDADGNGTREIDLPGMGTDPLRQDILVEVDWMFEDENGNGQEESGELSFRPIPAAIDYVIQRFAEAPVDNPGGTSGINLIVNLSNGLPEVHFNQSHPDSKLFIEKSADEVEFTPRYYAIKEQHMEPNMASISRYCVWIRRFTTFKSGQAEFPPGPADDFVISLGDLDPPNGNQGQQQGTFMHELGHTLGLYHGGEEPAPGKDIRHEPNYPSVMNYLHQFSGVLGKLSYDERAEADRYDQLSGDYIPICLPGVPGCKQYRWNRLCLTPDNGCVWTYSLGTLEPVNENQLSEQEGIQGIPGPVDWNFNGSIDPGLVGADLQGDSIREIQTDFNDWAHLVIPFW